MVNRNEYSVGLPAEEFDEHVPGGYHPISLHDTLDDGRYEIAHKLGFGSFATVWLARDHRTQRNVAIKVVMAKKSDEASRELAILQALNQRGDPTHPGRKHVAHPIDSFHHKGPNGRHLCVVLGLLGPAIASFLEADPGYRLEGPLARSVSRQLLLAVDYLHSTGIAHGDIHLGNVLFRVPEFETAPLEDLLEELGPPEIGKIVRYDGQPLEPGLPEYVVEPAEFAVDLDDGLCEVQLIDFSESFFIGDSPRNISTPVSFHPPELVFQHPLSSAVDIWNLGCTTYELVTGRAFFEAWMDDRKLIPQFKKGLGDVPDGWIQDAFTSGILKNVPGDSEADYLHPLEEEIRLSYFGNKREEPVLSEADLEVLGCYLRRMLVVDAKQRATARELLDDPWVAETGGVGDNDTAGDEQDSADKQAAEKEESGVVDKATNEVEQG